MITFGVPNVLLLITVIIVNNHGQYLNFQNAEMGVSAYCTQRMASSLFRDLSFNIWKVAAMVRLLHYCTAGSHHAKLNLAFHIIRYLSLLKSKISTDLSMCEEKDGHHKVNIPIKCVTQVRIVFCLPQKNNTKYKWLTIAPANMLKRQEVKHLKVIPVSAKE